MAIKKNKLKFVVTGSARYPKTNKPVRWDDTANRSVLDPEGKYECEVIVSATAADKIEKMLKAFAKEEGMSKPMLPLKPELVGDEETGNFIVKATQYGKDTDGKSKAIAHYDANTSRLPSDFVLTSGSEINMNVYASMWKKGVSLKIDGIQVIKYVEREEKNPFAKVDGGYTSDSVGDEDEVKFSPANAKADEDEDF